MPPGGCSKSHFLGLFLKWAPRLFHIIYVVANLDVANLDINLILCSVPQLKFYFAYFILLWHTTSMCRFMLCIYPAHKCCHNIPSSFPGHICCGQKNWNYVVFHILWCGYPHLKNMSVCKNGVVEPQRNVVVIYVVEIHIIKK